MKSNWKTFLCVVIFALLAAIALVAVGFNVFFKKPQLKYEISDVTTAPIEESFADDVASKSHAYGSWLQESLGMNEAEFSEFVENIDDYEKVNISVTFTSETDVVRIYSVECQNAPKLIFSKHSIHEYFTHVANYHEVGPEKSEEVVLVGFVKKGTDINEFISEIALSIEGTYQVDIPGTKEYFTVSATW